MKILLKIMYVGTDFSGYQVQNDKRTVQKCLCDAVNLIFGRECNVTGCSRTDKGVHANEFYATVSACDGTELDKIIPLYKIPLAMCANLPNDISVTEAFAVSDDFHARYDVEYKEYIYKIWNSPERNPFLENFAYHFPIKLSDDGIKNMQEAAKHFEGEHDFEAFMAKGSDVTSTVRNVKYCRIEKEGNLITLSIAADGFLYNMVRIIAGTLLFAGQGKILPCEIDDIILKKDRSRAGFTAPACGLYLNKVVYKK